MRLLAAVASLLGHASLGAAPLISEVMFHPPHPAGREVVQQEWIEIYNPGPTRTHLEGWRLEGVNFTFPNVSLPVGNYLVVAADLPTFRALYPTVTNVIGGWSGRLSNHGEALALLDPQGEERDRVVYGTEGDWAMRRPGPDDQGHTGWVWVSPADGGGKSLELGHLSLPNSSGQNWSPSIPHGGTPGAQNSVFSVNIPPLIEEVSHHPSIPGSADLVIVRARLTDNFGEPSGVVHYRVSTLNAGAFNSVSMRDDGRGGDERAGDGIHSALLPAQPEGTVVEFYLEASDAIQSRTWPPATGPAGTQGANLLYQVEPEVHTGSSPLYRLVLSVPENEEFLRISFDDPERRTNAQFNATFIGETGGEVTTIYQCSIRLRGAVTRGRYPRNLKVRLPAPHTWQGQAEFDLNSQFTYNQLLGSLFYREAGLPAYECKAVQVRMNGINHASEENAAQSSPFNRHYGMYVHNEPIDGSFVDHHFPLDRGGNLYRKTGSGTSWEYFPDSTDLAADYAGAGWNKKSNSAANDWSDLHNFLTTMSTAEDPDYLAQVEEVMDVESWLRTLAVSTILTNGEDSLFTGRDDDYALYRGRDGTFKLIPHDLDTILGQGDSNRIAISDLPHTLFDFVERGESLQQLERLFQEPKVLRRYYRILAELLAGPFEEKRINSLIDDVLSWTPRVQAILAKEFLAARRADILAAIDRPLTASASLPTVGGFPTTMDGQATLSGEFNPNGVQLVTVKGKPANLDHRTGTWNLTAIGLHPGINRLLIEELDEKGDPLSSAHFDVHFDDGNTKSIAGRLTADTVLDASSGPWQVTASLVVPAGITLTIEPGTTVYFEPGAGIQIEAGATLRCVGAPYDRIRLTRPLRTAGRWQGLDFTAPSGEASSTTENIIAHTDLEFGDGQGESITVYRSRLTLDHVTWENSAETVLTVFSPQVEVRDCVFPSVPSSEVIEGNTLSGDDYFILRRNLFVPSSGYQDLVCFNGGRRPGPIFAAYDNIFTGSTDDCLDLNNCDAHVEGNIFQNVHTDIPRTSTSNAIATDENANLTVVRNLFYDVDHAVLIKNKSSCVFENNTVVKATIGAINFDEPLSGGIEPGTRLDLDSNIFLACTAVFLNEISAPPEPNPVLNGHRNILPSAHAGIGVENLDLDPYLARLEAGPRPKSNWALLPGSPAMGSGRNGTDRGALVPQGATAFGLPAPRSSLNSATIRVEGPGITHYRYRLVTNGVPGPWSSDQPVSLLINLSGLAPGTYHLDLLARDSSGAWQDDAEFNSSRRWYVDPNTPETVVLNEIQTLSSPGTDQVELHNRTERPIMLDGWYLTDDPTDPQKKSLTGIALAAGAYQSLSTLVIPGLSPKSDALYLYNGPTLVDSVSWGAQIPGYSIGRLPSSTEWALTAPTFGAANRRAGTAPGRDLVINEWLASAGGRYSGEYVELYNPNDSPVPLGGLGISDSPDEQLRHRLPPLTFIPPRGFLLLTPADDSSLEADELPFDLDSFQGWIVLSDQQGSPIDQVRIACLHPDTPEGRHPDGSAHIQTFKLGTPGRSNNRPHTEVTAILLPFQASGWNFLDHGPAPSPDWIERAFDDLAWETGPAPLGWETAVLPVPLATHPGTNPAFDYLQGRKNYYFRRTFEFSGDPQLSALTLRTYLDDGAIFYLNGAEIYRHNMPPGVVDETTYALNPIDNASLEGPFELPGGRLTNGTNTLAVVTFQINDISSDIVFDCSLEVTELVPSPPSPEEEALQALLDNIRITEVMYDPPDGNDAEFIEVRNISDTLTLDLLGVRFTEGVDFVFPELLLGPGERAVVIKDLGLFRSIHGHEPRVAGQFSSKLDNGGDTIALTLPAPWDINIQRFTYRDTWFDQTNSFGRSLELIDASRKLSSWNDGTSWIASLAIHGSPGMANSGETFRQWSTTLRAGPGDTDGDKVGDPLEYALGTDPHTPEFIAVLQDLELTPGADLRSTFLIPAIAPPDVTFHLQSSTEAGIWTTRATRVGNGPWLGSEPVEEARPPSGMGLVNLRLSANSSTLLTRLLVVIAEE